MPSVHLKSGREKSVLRRHPWIFSGAIGEVSGSPGPGDIVKVFSASGQFLARGAYSPQSQIRVRIWTWDENQTVDAALLHQRLAQAIELRTYLLAPGTTDAMRLVHAESDGLPGLVVDRYADLLVLQSLAWGIEPWLETICDSLVELTGLQRIFERSDAQVRTQEGLEFRCGPLRGSGFPDLACIQEHHLRYWVDYREGHKTGFYLDQRANRRKVKELSREREVLDCFSYSGGFSLAALSGGARQVVAVESSAAAIDLGRMNLALNGFQEQGVEWIEGDVFQLLRGWRDRRRSFDMIVLDPPRFAPTAHQVGKATRAYKDINLLALKLLHPGGILVTFSCSGGITAELFQKILAGAALDARVDVLILERLYQGFDHPVALSFPEGAYLKGLVLQVI